MSNKIRFHQTLIKFIQIYRFQVCDDMSDLLNSNYRVVTQKGANVRIECEYFKKNKKSIRKYTDRSENANFPGKTLRKTDSYLDIFQNDGEEGSSYMAGQSFSRSRGCGKASIDMSFQSFDASRGSDRGSFNMSGQSFDIPRGSDRGSIPNTPDQSFSIPRGSHKGSIPDMPSNMSRGHEKGSYHNAGQSSGVSRGFGKLKNHKAGQSSGMSRGFGKGKNHKAGQSSGISRETDELTSYGAGQPIDTTRGAISKRAPLLPNPMNALFSSGNSSNTHPTGPMMLNPLSQKANKRSAPDDKPFPDEIKKEIRVLKGCEVYVCHIKSPSCFYVQTAEWSSCKKVKIQQKCAIEANNNKFPDKFKLNSLYLVQDPKDLKWYRCRLEKIEKMSPRMKGDVLYVDYGRSEEVDCSNLRECSAELQSIPSGAVKCCIYNLQPPNSVWEDQVNVIFSTILNK